MKIINVYIIIYYDKDIEYEPYLMNTVYILDSEIMENTKFILSYQITDSTENIWSSKISENTE